MPSNITSKLDLEVSDGPKISSVSAIQTQAFDHIAVDIPDTTAAPVATTVDVQPSAAGKVKLVLIRSSKYDDKLKYKVHDGTGTERTLNEVLLLVGTGAVALLAGTGQLDKLLVTNTTGATVTLDIVVGRDAI